MGKELENEAGIMVSIVTTAYNHGPYIAQALDSFLMQKTDFPFEVIVHDDASTDGTAEIIRRYASEYPDIIKPIYQTVNQYSQGINIYSLITPYIRGKYVATCEGDDYWTDPMKLQKQVDAMEAHPEINICSHAALCERDGKIIKEIKPSSKDVIFNVSEVIKRGGGMVATASLLYRYHFDRKGYTFVEIHNFDYSNMILGSLQGGMLYLKDNMAVYRLMVKNSWSSNMNSNVTKFEAHLNKVDEMLKQMNQETNHQYEAEIQFVQKKIEYQKLEIHKQYKQMLSSDYKEIRKSMPLKKKLRIFMFAIFPGYEKIRSRLVKLLRR